MKVVIEIPDKEAAFALKVLKSLSFLKNAIFMSGAAADLWEDLNEAAEQVRLHKQGKITLKTAQDLLNEPPETSFEQCKEHYHLKFRQ